MERERVENIEVRVAKALSHPLRQRIIRALAANEASPRGIAAELGEPLPNVSNHMRILADLGCVELVRTRQRRGATEHFYRATISPALDDAQWERLPVDERERLVSSTLSDIAHDIAAARQHGALGRHDLHVSRTLLALDVQGWKELGSELERVVEEALRINAESARRVADTGGRLRDSELVLLQFDRRDST